MISANQTILFQGDSITDGGRDYALKEPNSPAALSPKYPGIIAAQLLKERPADNLRFFNRGNSGDRVTNLLARWNQDTVHLQPDLLSILVGVNETYHLRPRLRTGLSHNVYEKGYRLLLEYTRESLPKTRIVLCEPFAMAYDEISQADVEDLLPRRVAVKKLAKEFDTIYVPFQDLFDSLLDEGPVEKWLPDGFHPSDAGHEKMAALWRKHVGV